MPPLGTTGTVTVALSCVFTVAAIVLLNLPMGMRHGM